MPVKSGTFVVEVEGALGWKREHLTTTDPDEARHAARCLASRDGAERVTRVLSEGQVLLEILGWSQRESGPLAEGRSTALGPRDPIPYAEATYRGANKRDSRVGPGPKGQMGLF